MPDCASCNRPLGKNLPRCKNCGACKRCCACDNFSTLFDADELGLDPETYDLFVAEQKAEELEDDA